MLKDVFFAYSPFVLLPTFRIKKISFANSDSFIVILIFCIKSAMIFTKITQNIFAIVKKEGVVPFKIFMNMTKVLFMYLVSISTSNKNTKIQKKTYLL